LLAIPLREENMERLNLSIDGMSCGHCLNAVRGALSRLPGVQVDSVTIGRASVEFDPAASSAERIAAAIADAGYPAHAIPA
jgi:copper chaperone